MPLSFTAAGLTVQTLGEIRSEVEIALRDPSAFGPDFDVSADTPEGNIIGVLSERERLIQEMLLLVNAACSPLYATGVRLDDISALTGTVRRAATSSTIAGDFVFNGAGTIPAGSIVQHNPNGTQWQTLVDIVAAGAGTETGEVSSIDTGEIQATITADWTIITPVGVWDSFESTAAVTLGNDTETDSELRARRKAELATLGAATIPAIIANVGQVDGVTGVFVFENRTDTVDGAGRPAHSFETVVEGGADQDIADEVFRNKPAGVETFGTEGPFTYSEDVGNGQTFTDVYFSRVVTVTMEIRVTVTITGAETSYPGDGDDLIKAAVLAFGQTHVVGEDVLPHSFIGPVFGAFLTAVPPIRDVLIEVKEFGAGSFVTAPFTIDEAERAGFDITKITVVQV